MKNSSKKKWKLNRLTDGRQAHVKAGYGAVLCTLLTVILAINAVGCGGAVYQYQLTDIAMGTMVSVNVYTGQPDGEKLPERLMDRIAELEEQELSWRVDASEVGRINAAAGSGTPVLLSNDLQEDLEELLEVSRRSGGAFDVTIGAVSRLWNIDGGALGNAVIPQPAEVAEALAATGFKKLLVSEESDAPTASDASMAGGTPKESGTPAAAISLADGIALPADMSLDLGAVGKGIACDRLRDCLEQEKVTGAVISVGGSIMTYGSKPDGSPWQVGIVNPHDTASLLGTLTLNGEWYVSTSGDYERYIEVDGKVYHHIIDPATGYPADSGLKSVTILCKSGILSDALSTACFVLGLEEGMVLAESYGAEALFVDEDGNIYMTEQIKKIFKET